MHTYVTPSMFAMITLVEACLHVVALPGLEQKPAKLISRGPHFEARALYTAGLGQC